MGSFVRRVDPLGVAMRFVAALLVSGVCAREGLPKPKTKAVKAAIQADECTHGASQTTASGQSERSAQMPWQAGAHSGLMCPRANLHEVQAAQAAKALRRRLALGVGVARCARVRRSLVVVGAQGSGKSARSNCAAAGLSHLCHEHYLARNCGDQSPASRPRRERAVDQSSGNDDRHESRLGKRARRRHHHLPTTTARCLRGATRSRTRGDFFGLV